ncbi:MAG: adenosine kinase [Acidimicrobiales bacterium]
MADKQFDVVGIGNAIVDVIAHVDDGFIDANGLNKGIMTLIDADRATELYAAMPPALEASGGSAANTMAGVASFGGSVAYVGKVRQDQLGEVFRHDIRAVGVHYEQDLSGNGLPTARCLILVTPDAERTMNTFLGISSLLEPDDVREDLVAAGRVIYCEGYLWDVDSAKAAIRKAMAIGKANGAKVALTLSDTFCVDRHRAEFLHLVEHDVDIVFANEAEICSLYETDDVEQAMGRVRGHAEIACVTRSAKGSVILTADQVVTVPSWSTGTVVDTTGAGDLYAAGFLHGLTSGKDLFTSGWYGSVAAGECIGHTGPRPERRLADLVTSVPVPARV